MPRLLRRVARVAVVAGTATAVSGRVSRRQQGRWAAQDAPADAPQAVPEQAAAPPAEAASTGDMFAELAQLGELKASGVLTQAEFDAQKAKLLAV
jgi:hypothetical protein